MKILWILSAFLGFTLPEKLDRIYLPPPGAKFSGGIPGDIDVPLELPKETNPSSSQDKHFGRPEIAMGIDRVGLNILPEKYGDVTSTLPSFHGNSYGFPTTTTSYAFSQTTSYVPAVDSTIGPDISIKSIHPFNNPTSGDFIEKNLSFDNTRPNNVYNAEEKQMLNDINNILEDQLPDNKINSQVVDLSDENVRSNNGDVNNIPEIISHSGGLGIPGITSTPTEVDHSLLDNHYNTYHRPSLSEPSNEQDVILIPSTPRPLDNIYSKTPSQYVSTSPIGISNIPYSYSKRPEAIQAKDREAVIPNYDNTITPEGYAYSFDTSNGIHADEKGTAINGVRAEGSYSYIGDDGQLYSVNYTADENGFRPHGTHLPTSPPIPDAILKVIEQAEIDKANGIYDDGSYDENKYGYQKYNPTKNMRFFNQYNKDRESTNLNRRKNNNQLPYSTRLDENFNKNNDTNEENIQKVIPKTKLQPFIKNELLNESVPENSDNYKSEHFVNIGNNHIDSNNDYNKNVQNEILNTMPHLEDTEKEDRRMSIEFDDETGYHYSKPQNDYALKVANKLINRFPETPASINIPGMYKKIVENIPVISFMTPDIPRNDDKFVERDGDDQSFNIPTKFHEEENVIFSNQNTSSYPTLAETYKVPGKTENRIIHNFNNQFKADISPSSDQGYLYGNVNSNNDNYVPFITSTESGLSDITSTLSTADPPKFNAIDSSKDTNSRIPYKHSESSLFQNPALLNNSLDQEKYVGPLAYSNNLDNYRNDNDDITDSRARYNMPNTYGANRDYIIDQSTAKTYNKDFSGPKQAQKYDPLTGYHY